MQSGHQCHQRNPRILRFERISDRRASPAAARFTIRNDRAISILEPAGRAFAGNLIPIGRISPAAAKILAAFPAPQTSAVLNNFIGSGSGPFTQNSFDTRIDYAASSTMNVFGRFSLDYFKLSGKGLLGAVGGPGNGLLGLAGSSITHNYSLASGFTKTISTFAVDRLPLRLLQIQSADPEA